MNKKFTITIDLTKDTEEMVSTGGSNPLSLRSSRSGATNNGKFAVAVGSIRTSER